MLFEILVNAAAKLKIKKIKQSQIVADKLVIQILFRIKKLFETILYNFTGKIPYTFIVNRVQVVNFLSNILIKNKQYICINKIAIAIAPYYTIEI